MVPHRLHAATARPLHGFRIAAIVADGFEQVELKGPRHLLESAGAAVDILAPEPWVVRGYNHDRPAGITPINLSLRFADHDEYDALLVPGGPRSTQALQWDPDALALIAAMDARRRPIAAVDDGARLLIAAGLVADRALACHARLADAVRLAGGLWLDAPVVHQQNWLTARGPRELRQMTSGFIAVLAAQRWGRAVARRTLSAA